MAALGPSTKVLIVGSGLAGVSLAQILRKESVAFEIFERDDGTRSQGWNIGLDE
jgi:2-polyprenyl-6-methoxyphenol hydroxylase-like FAD-dependent oxidoreductase